MAELTEFERELVSAYVDGEVEASERAVVEQLLAENPIACAFRDDLSKLHEALRGLAFAAQTARPLGERFTGRVIELALRARSHRQHTSDLPLGHPFELDEASTDAPVFVHPRQSGQGFEGGASRTPALKAWTALAASLIFLCVAPAYFVWMSSALPTVRPHSFQMVHDASGAVKSGAVKSGEIKKVFEENPKLDEPSIASLHSPVSADVGSDPNTVVASSKTASDAGAALVHDATPVAPTFFFVIDVTLSNAAWNDGQFESVLKASGIELEPIAIGEDDIKASLEKTLVIVGNRGTKSKSKAALVYVQARGNDIDKIVASIYQNEVAFTEVSFNMAIDNQWANLKSRLDVELAKFNRDGQPRSVAAALVANSTAVRNVSAAAQFEPTPRTAVLVSNRREPLPSFNMFAGVSEMNPMSQVLFVLRGSE